MHTVATMALMLTAEHGGYSNMADSSEPAADQTPESGSRCQRALRIAIQDQAFFSSAVGLDHTDTAGDGCWTCPQSKRFSSVSCPKKLSRATAGGVACSVCGVCHCCQIGLCHAGQAATSPCCSKPHQCCWIIIVVSFNRCPIL